MAQFKFRPFKDIVSEFVKVKKTELDRITGKEGEKKLPPKLNEYYVNIEKAFEAIFASEFKDEYKDKLTAELVLKLKKNNDEALKKSLLFANIDKIVGINEKNKFDLNKDEIEKLDAKLEDLLTPTTFKFPTLEQLIKESNSTVNDWNTTNESKSSLQKYFSSNDRQDQVKYINWIISRISRITSEGDQAKIKEEATDRQDELANIISEIETSNSDYSLDDLRKSIRIQQIEAYDKQMELKEKSEKERNALNRYIEKHMETTLSGYDLILMPKDDFDKLDKKFKDKPYLLKTQNGKYEFWRLNKENKWQNIKMDDNFNIPVEWFDKEKNFVPFQKQNIKENEDSQILGWLAETKVFVPFQSEIYNTLSKVHNSSLDERNMRQLSKKTLEMALTGAWILIGDKIDLVDKQKLSRLVGWQPSKTLRNSIDKTIGVTSTNKLDPLTKKRAIAAYMKYLEPIVQIESYNKLKKVASPAKDDIQAQQQREIEHEVYLTHRNPEIKLIKKMRQIEEKFNHESNEKKKKELEAELNQVKKEIEKITYRSPLAMADKDHYHPYSAGVSLLPPKKLVEAVKNEKNPKVLHELENELLSYIPFHHEDRDGYELRFMSKDDFDKLEDNLKDKLYLLTTQDNKYILRGLNKDNKWQYTKMEDNFQIPFEWLDKEKVFVPFQSQHDRILNKGHHYRPKTVLEKLARSMERKDADQYHRDLSGRNIFLVSSKPSDTDLKTKYANNYVFIDNEKEPNKAKLIYVNYTEDEITHSNGKKEKIKKLDIKNVNINNIDEFKDGIRDTEGNITKKGILDILKGRKSAFLTDKQAKSLITQNGDFSHSKSRSSYVTMQKLGKHDKVTTRSAIQKQDDPAIQKQDDYRDRRDDLFLITLISEKTFNQLSRDLKTRVYLIKTKNNKYSLWGNIEGKWQRTNMEDNFQIPNGWANKSKKKWKKGFGVLISRNDKFHSILEEKGHSINYGREITVHEHEAYKKQVDKKINNSFSHNEIDYVDADFKMKMADSRHPERAKNELYMDTHNKASRHLTFLGKKYNHPEQPPSSAVTVQPVSNNKKGKPPIEPRPNEVKKALDKTKPSNKSQITLFRGDGIKNKDQRIRQEDGSILKPPLKPVAPWVYMPFEDKDKQKEKKLIEAREAAKKHKNDMKETPIVSDRPSFKR